MADRPLRSVLHFVRRVAASANVAPEGDAQLLLRFVQARDEVAFESIVRRHGPMVFGVCRRIVGDVHHAEDCFQAVFLVLARKADSLRKPERLANWLYGVARRIAFKAASAAKKNDRRPQILHAPSPDASETAALHDLRRVLDDELGRLPDRYRTSIVLCYLEGRTTQEAALALGCPQGTVMTWLARGRERLRSRLSRRGVTLTTGLLTVETLSAAVPVALMESTVRIAILTGAGGITAAVTSLQIAALAQGVIKAMFWTKVTLTAGILATVGGIGATAGWFAHLDAPVTQDPAPPAAAKVEPVADDESPTDALEKLRFPTFDEQKVKTLLRDMPIASDKLKSLLEARHAAIAIDANARRLEFLNGRGWFNMFLESAKNVLHAELELCTTREDRLIARQRHLRVAQLAYAINKARWDAERIAIQDLKGAEYFMLDAEIGLEREKTNKN